MNNKYGLSKVLTIASLFVSVHPSTPVATGMTKGNFRMHRKSASAVVDPRQNTNKASKLLFLINFFCLDKETNLENVLL